MLLFLANTITADMGLIPGLSGIGPAWGLPLSVLAALIERPFYTLGGISNRTIWYSLQANLVSLLIGYIAMLLSALVAAVVHSEIGFFEVWPFFAVAVSTVVEGLYLSRRLHTNKSFWLWNIAGNVVSASLSVGLLFLILWMRDAYPTWRISLAPLAGYLNFSAFGGSIILFVVAFLRTRSASPKEQPNQTHAGA